MIFTGPPMLEMIYPPYGRFVSCLVLCCFYFLPGVGFPALLTAIFIFLASKVINQLLLRCASFFVVSDMGAFCFACSFLVLMFQLRWFSSSFLFSFRRSAFLSPPTPAYGIIHVERIFSRTGVSGVRYSAEPFRCYLFSPLTIPLFQGIWARWGRWSMYGHPF